MININSYYTILDNNLFIWVILSTNYYMVAIMDNLALINMHYYYNVTNINKSHGTCW